MNGRAYVERVRKTFRTRPLSSLPLLALPVVFLSSIASRYIVRYVAGVLALESSVRFPLMSIIALLVVSEASMSERQVVISASLLAVILLLTLFTVGTGARPPSLGMFSQYIFPALLTVYLLVVLANARVIIELLAAFMLGGRKQEKSGFTSAAYLIGYAIAIILVFLFIRTLMAQRIIEALQAAMNLASTWFSPNQVQKPPSSGGVSFNPFVYYYSTILFGIIVVVSFSLLFGGLRTAYRWAREERDVRNRTDSQANATRREALAVVRKATMGLRLTGDYRDVILRCYRQMCQVLSENGFSIGIQETAREFSQSISQKLGLKGDAVASLTFLFEEARYSDHQIDSDKRSLALNQLQSLERSLAGTDG